MNQLVSYYKRAIKPLQDLLRKIILPGFEGVPLYDALMFFFRGIFEGALSNRAASVSYSFFMAIFPGILVFFTLIPFVPIDNFQDLLLNLLQEFIPEQTWGTVKSTLEDIITRPRKGLLSLSFVMAIYFSTNGISSLIDGFNSTAHAIQKRSWLKQRLISFILLFLLSGLIIISIATLTTGSIVINYLYDKQIINDDFTYALLIAAKWLISILLIFTSISFIYFYGPAKSEKFRFISPGGILTTFLIILSTLLFNYYIDHFSSYNALYGSIGTLLIFLFWLYFNATILLIGFELNASIKHASKNQESSS